MRTISTLWSHACLLLVSVLSLTATAAEKTAPSPSPDPPDEREVWVPSNQLAKILARHPHAVVLSREQYSALLQEAKRPHVTPPSAPRRAALGAARYEARLIGKTVQVTGTLTVSLLSDEWSQVSLDFQDVSIGTVEVDGEAAFQPPDNDARDSTLAPTTLLVRGRGERVVTVEFSVPATSAAGLSRISCQLPPVASSAFRLVLPPGQRVESAQPILVLDTPETTTVTAAPSPAQPLLKLAWRSAGAGAQALAPLVTVSGFHTIDAERMHVEYALAIETQLGNLAAEYQLTVPENGTVLQVAGDDVAKWEVTEGRLRVTLQPGERSAANFRLVVDLPSLAGAPNATLPLFVPRLEGLGRMRGTLSIIGDDGVIIKAVQTDATLQPAKPTGDAAAHFVAAYDFITPPTAPRVQIEKTPRRFSADLDTLVDFKPEAIFTERTLTLHEEKGETFQVALTLPPDEEIMTVRKADESEPDWRIADGKLVLRWSERAQAEAPVFKIRTRREPRNWTQLDLDGQSLAIGDAKVEGAEKITGYIALKADESLRLEAAPSETLERRDGRTTPVVGDYAWFRGQDFALTVKVAKRPGEILAALTGYALPLEGILDLHAQINFQFLHSGARSVRIQVPEALAANFYFDGPQIAERNLAGNVWTIVFQKELAGSYALTVAAQVAVEKASGKADEETRFQTAVPLIVPLDAMRTSGVWAIEANTETEIQFEAKGMNELDSLLAPQLPDYQPRHRVIGVFAWLGKEYTLALSGVRHAPATMLGSVVDLLELDTVVSTSGAERDQATFRLRTAGAQYLEVQLPAKSRLLSVTVDGEVVKPVGDRAEQVRVPLTAKREGSISTTVSVLYETPKGEWEGKGVYAARAPKLGKGIPILRSEWRLYLPEGFEYTGLTSNLRAPAPDFERPLALRPFSLYDEWRADRQPAIVRAPAPSDNRPASTPDDRSLVERLEQEKARRSDYERRGQEAMTGGDRALAEKDYEKATAEYRRACDIIPNAPLTGTQFRRALQRFAEASGKLAEQRITEGRLGEAESILRTVLDERYDPGNKQAILLLARLEQPDFFNRTISPQFRANVEQVKQWFIEAQGFYDTGRYDLAKKRCEQILTLDKYNIAARKMEERIDQKISDYGIAAYNETRSRAIGQIDLAWNRPVRRFGGTPVESSGQSDGTETIRRKLHGIIIPKLEFREATVREAIDFLKKKASEIDADSPPGARGVNIVLKLEDNQPPPSTAPAAEARITVSLSNVPLIEALRYVTGLANLSLRIEPYAVAVVPMSEPTDVLATKEWKIPPELIPRHAAPAEPATGGSGIADREIAKNWLIARGITFSPQASAVYIVRSSRLIVRNTRDQLDLIDTLIDGSDAREWRVDHSLFQEIVTTEIDHEKVQQWLAARGVKFAGTSSATYYAPVGRQKMGLSSTGSVTSTATLPALGRLVVRNSANQLDLIGTILYSGGGLSAAQAMSEEVVESIGVSGLLPMKLDLPKVGRVIVLEGLAAAEHVEFHYYDWWNRARRLWLWFVGGGLLGLFLAGPRPWWRTCWALLLLTFFPYCISMAFVSVCNALLAGWLVSVVLQRLVVRWVLAPRRKEVLA